MKKLFLIPAFLPMAMLVSAQKNLANDPAHSRIQFEITHLGINDITGNFNTATLGITTDDKNFSNSKINFNVDVNSINTNVEMRDNHLKSEDFFDAAKFPTMNFVSTSIKPAKDKDNYILSGNLTMHGITKSVTLNLIYKGSTLNPMSKATTYAYQVNGSLKRSDFGIGAKFPNAMLSDEVRIKGDFEMSEKQ
jgi:polyisoprenoid-binding protein YceI